MSDFRISIPSGESRRLKTGGKYCPSDIIVEATGGDTSHKNTNTGILAVVQATMQSVSNQCIVFDTTNYVGDVIMEENNYESKV